MADNYIKISQLPDTGYYNDNSKLADNLYTTGNSVISINNLANCIISDCLLPDNTVKIVLKPNTNAFEISVIPYNPDKITELYYTFNENKMGWEQVLNGSSNNFTIIENNQIINNIVLSGWAYDIVEEQEPVTDLISQQSDNGFINTNIFKSISFNNTPIMFLELNDSTLEELRIINCSSLKSCILGEFNNLNEITITKTKCHTNIRIGKLSNSPIINLENNQLNHIEFIGNGLTRLTSDNCKIIKQQNKKKLKSVCFINCNISDELLTELQNNNVIVYNLKRADF